MKRKPSDLRMNLSGLGAITVLISAIAVAVGIIRNDATPASDNTVTHTDRLTRPQGSSAGVEPSHLDANLRAKQKTSQAEVTGKNYRQVAPPVLDDTVTSLSEPHASRSTRRSRVNGNPRNAAIRSSTKEEVIVGTGRGYSSQSLNGTDAHPFSGSLNLESGAVRQPAHESVATALENSDLSSLTPHQQAAVTELAAYVKEAEEAAVPDTGSSPDIPESPRQPAVEADEYLRVTLGKDSFNQLSFIAAGQRGVQRTEKKVVGNPAAQ